MKNHNEKPESGLDLLIKHSKNLGRVLAVTSAMATAALTPTPAGAQDAGDVPAQSFEDIVKSSTLKDFKKLKLRYDKVLENIRNGALVQNVPQMTRHFEILDAMKNFLRNLQVSNFSDRDIDPEVIRDAANEELKMLAGQMSYTLADNMSLDLAQALGKFSGLENLAAAKLKGFSSEDGGFLVASNIYALYRNERGLINE